MASTSRSPGPSGPSGPDRHPDGIALQAHAEGTAVHRRIAEAHHLAGGVEEVVPGPRRRGREPDDVGVAQARPRRPRAEEPGVAEGEHRAVAADEPVALTAGHWLDAHDRLVEGLAGRRAVEPSVAKVEEAAVRSHQPVAGTARGPRHPDNR